MKKFFLKITVVILLIIILISLPLFAYEPIPAVVALNSVQRQANLPKALASSQLVWFAKQDEEKFFGIPRQQLLQQHFDVIYLAPLNLHSDFYHTTNSYVISEKASLGTFIKNHAQELNAIPTIIIYEKNPQKIKLVSSVQPAYVVATIKNNQIIFSNLIEKTYADLLIKLHQDSQLKNQIVSINAKTRTIIIDLNAHQKNPKTLLKDLWHSLKNSIQLNPISA